MTSSDHPNAVRLHDAYTKWFTGMASTMINFMADDVVMHLPGKHLGGGDVIGRDAILARGREQGASFDRLARSDILDVVANDTFAITMERWRAERHGRSIDQLICATWRIADGRIAEIWTHFEDPEACDAFWA